MSGVLDSVAARGRGTKRVVLVHRSPLSLREIVLGGNTTIGGRVMRSPRAVRTMTTEAHPAAAPVPACGKARSRQLPSLTLWLLFEKTGWDMKKRFLAAVAVLGIVLAACGNNAGVKHPAGAGAATPQAAVGNLLNAISQGRYDQALLDLAPGEYDALNQPVTTMLSQLVRLGVIDPTTSLSHFPGFTFVFSNPTYSVTSIGSGVDFVQFTGGTVTATATPSQLPIGPKLQPVLSQLVAKAHPASKTSQLAGPNAGLATIQQDGRWYVSLGYSIAEAARRSDNLPPPSASGAISPSGDSSADAAVRDFLNSAASLNLSRMIALTPPDEEPALGAYASLFLPKAEARLGKVQNVTVKINSVSFSDEALPDGTLVHLKGLVITGSIRGTKFTYTNGCITIDTVATVQFCKTNLQQLLSSQHAPAAVTNLVNIVANLKPNYGITAVKEGGKWYVSPVRTVLDNFDALLAAFTPQQVDQIVNDIEQLEPQLHVHPNVKL
jgi:hypothetical protein